MGKYADNKLVYIKSIEKNSFLIKKPPYLGFKNYNIWNLNSNRIEKNKNNK